MTSALDLESQLAFADEVALQQWALDHAQIHLNYAVKLYSIYKVQSPMIDLTDEGAMSDWVQAMQDQEQGAMTPRLRDWLFAHQKIHLAELQAIGAGSTVDLQTVDFHDKDQFYDWMYNHQQIHDVEDTIL